MFIVKINSFRRFLVYFYDVIGAMQKVCHSEILDFLTLELSPPRKSYFIIFCFDISTPVCKMKNVIPNSVFKMALYTLLVLR